MELPTFRRSAIVSALVLALVFIMSRPSSVVLADFAGGREVLHTCINNVTRNLRVPANFTACMVGETQQDWRLGPEIGTEFPLMCGSCYLQNTDRLADRDLTNAWLVGANLMGATLTGATFTGADLSQASFQGASFSGSDLTDVNFFQSNLSGATGLASSTLTGINWSESTCPDGSHADDNEGTCEGHLTPSE